MRHADGDCRCHDAAINKEPSPPLSHITPLRARGDDARDEMRCERDAAMKQRSEAATYAMVEARVSY